MAPSTDMIHPVPDAWIAREEAFGEVRHIEEEADQIAVKAWDDGTWIENEIRITISRCVGGRTDR
jgi:hypothetical protein